MAQDVKQQKNALRKQYRGIRSGISQEYSKYAAASLLNAFKQNMHLIKGETVSSYLPIDGEIDTIPLMNYLFDSGYNILIPSHDRSLTFEEWKVSSKYIEPCLIIVPIVAFDVYFNRLGFGSGWYDRIIEHYRALNKVFIGVAYEKQCHIHIPSEQHDQKLDVIITEVCIRLSAKK